MPDEAKVNAILSTLNGGNTGNDWIAVEGLHAIYSVIIERDNSQTVNPRSGITVKLFFNTKTGEVKTYVANLLK